MSANWRPSHAYVPGQNARHAEDIFDHCKAGLEGLAVEQFDQSLAWRYGQGFLADGYYWEAHEVLEALWMACPPNAPEKLMIQAVIQFANAKLKERMQRPNAAARLREQAARLAAEAVARNGGPVLGLVTIGHGLDC